MPTTKTTKLSNINISPMTQGHVSKRRCFCEQPVNANCTQNDVSGTVGVSRLVTSEGEE
ncbi:hypothetical protein [Novipirellula aureliae]|uniref:hypothetical protein n=1 Tax=Novipirellula aureliae TaxID=2527966 RepID=UPI0018CDBA20|nr:hypothetical protein [Novipirellula aureliae]